MQIIKKSSLGHLLYASAAFVLLGASGASANTDIDLRDVASGTITIDKVDATRTKIGTSDKAIGNFNSFGVAEGSSVGVDIAGGGNALFRVVGGNPSDILGNLSVNGKLMLVNPNGVFFGTNARVDVGSLVASTADMADSDFLAGKMNFSKAGKAGAGIVNKGSITAKDGGLVALIAPSVRNDGVIEANLGTVALASAETASVDFYGDNLYSFALNGKTTAVGVDENGNAVKSAVENNGIVKASGGKVLLTANVAKGVVDNVINNTGIIEASSAHVDGGAIVLDGGDGKVRVSGKLAATGNKGGSVTVTGDEIEVTKANIDVSGKAAGGSVKIGGDYQGGGTLKHAKKVTVDADSKIDVSAKETGNGGQAVVWSDELTDFNGSIVGKGGAVSGNGGSAEVSSKGELGFAGSVDLSAANGKSGTLLLDPDDLFIGAFIDHFVGTDHFVSASAIVAILNSGTNVIEAALNDIFVSAGILWSGAGSLTLNAGHNIAINADVKASYAGGTGAEGSTTLNAGNNIAITGARVTASRGNINATGVDFAMTNSAIKTLTGNVDINNSGIFSNNIANSITGKGVKLRQNVGGSIQNAIDAIGPTGSVGAFVQLGSGVWTEALNIDQGTFTLNGNGSLNTRINAPAPTTSQIISVNNVANVKVANIWFEGGQVGVSSTKSNNFTIANSIIAHAAVAGIKLDSILFTSVSSDIFINNGVGVLSTNSTLERISGNSFTGGGTAMLFNGDKSLNIQFNNITGNGLNDGFILNNVTQSPVTSNTFRNLANVITINGGSSVVASKNKFFDVNQGINSFASNGLQAAGNSFVNTLNKGNFAIHTEGGLNLSISGNTIDNFFDGIIALGATRPSIFNNIINNVYGGITVDSLFTDTGVVGADLLETKSSNVVLTGNIINALSTGIYVSLANSVNVNGNNLSGGNNGLDAENVTGLTINANNFHDNGTGLFVWNSPSVTFSNNIVENNTYNGATFFFADFLASTNNTFNNNPIANTLVFTNNATLSGDVFNNSSSAAISLSAGSANTLISGVTISNPIGAGYGVQITDGSSATLQGVAINDGYIGVLLDGAGSSMQFALDTSSFTGQSYYFVLQNDAMSGSVLDASQQTFGGVRAVDFTLLDRDFAEGITIDSEDGLPTIGDVFYKSFDAPVI